MKKINALLILVLILVLGACTPRENSKETEGDVHMNYLRGIILEVKENKTIVHRSYQCT